MNADERTEVRHSNDEALRESETRYRTLFESLDAAVLLMRGDMCVECNPATLALFGVASKDEIIGKTPLDFAPAKQPDGRDSAELVRRNAEMALEKGLHVFEWQAFKKGGEPVFMEVRFTPYRIGNEQYFQCIAIDITERKRAEEELRKSEALLAKSQEIAHVGSWILEVTRNQLTWSDEVYRIFGLEPREFGATYEAFLDSVHPDDRAAVDAAYSGSLRDGSDGYEIEHRIIRKKSGEILHVHEKCTHERDAGGRIVRSVGMVQDITERKRAEEAQRESEERWRSVVETTAAWIWETDANIRHVYTNRFVTHCLGYQPDEFLGFDIPSLIHPDDRHLLEAIVRGATGKKKGWSGQVLRWRHKDGSWKYIETSGVPVFDRQGNFCGLRGVDHDITERRSAQEMLRENEAQLSLVFNSTSEMLALIRVEPDGRFIIQALNRSYLSNVSSAFPGVSIEDFIGSEREELIRALAITQVPDTETALERAAKETALYRAAVTTRTEIRYEVELPSPAGNMILDINLTPILDRDGTCTHVLWNARNITERRRADAALRESEEKYRVLVETTNTGFVILDGGGRVVDANDEYVRQSGHAVQDEIRGRSVVEWTAPYDRERNAAEVSRCLEKGFVRNLEIDYLHADGRIVPVEINATVMGAGAEMRIYSVCRDVSLRRHAVESLRESEERYRQLFDAESDAIFLIDNETGGILMANDAAAVLYGYGREELLTKKNTDLSAEPSETRRITQETPIRKENRVTISLRYHRKKDGTVFPVEITGRFFHSRGRSVHIAAIRDITERKQTEDALKEEREFVVKALNAQLDTFFVFEPHTGMVLRWNSRFRDVSGYSDEEIARLKAPDAYYDQADLEKAARALEKIGREGAGTVELELVCKDGRKVPFEYVASVIYSDAGEPTSIISIGRDITERKRAEAALRESEERFRVAIEFLPSPIGIADERGNILHYNAAFTEGFGYRREDIPTIEDWILRAYPDPVYRAEARNQWNADVLEAIRTGTSTPAREYRITCKDGSQRYVEIVTRPMRDRWITVFTDITERKRAEEALRESESRLRTVTENAPDTILRVDRRGVITFVNRPMPGLPVDRVIGSTVFTWVPEEQHPVVARALEQAFDSGRRQEYESAGPGPHGEPRLYNVRVMPVNVGERIESAIYIATDITERKRAEEALEESERSLKTLMGNLPGMAYRCLYDRDRTMVYVSEGSYALTGHYPADLVGNADLSYNDLIHPDDREVVWHAVQTAVEKKEKYTLLYRIRRAEGQERWVWEQGQGVFSATGALLALEGFIIDVTERQLLEEERLKTQKLESVGTLAGGIAHDFNNLLQGIFGYISMAKITIDRKERSLEMLQQAEKALHHAVSLTNQLLTFSKGGKPVKRRMSLAPLIDDAVKFALSGSTTDYRIEVGEDLFSVEADGGQIAQVIQNVVLNADQAMPMGGTVLVTAGNAHAPGPGVPAQLAEGDYVTIAVQDSGVGIPEKYLARIFDPYFTTKEKGSGLGLATSYSIIRNHNGLIDVRSVVGTGSVFTIYLPAKAVSAEPAAAGPAAAGPSRKSRVLIMDDEEIVRSVAKELIQLLGHEADDASDGREAIEKYQQATAAGRPFDVVILDLTIRGGMGGLETIQRLRDIDSNVIAVVSSGYSDDAIESEFRTHGFRAFLKKPYNTEDLKNILNSIPQIKKTMSP